MTIRECGRELIKYLLTPNIPEDKRDKNLVDKLKRRRRRNFKLGL